MKRRYLGLVSGVAVTALAVTLAPTTAQAGPTPAPRGEAKIRPGGDNLPNPLGDAQARLRTEALTKLIEGKATLEGRGSDRVIKLAGNPNARAGDPAARSRWVWYPTEREESIFSILTEFGTKTMAATGGTPGPVHNQIAAPDRNWNGDATDNNSTYWVRDFNRAHFMNLMFGDRFSFKDFYKYQSKGKFLAKGDVSDWVKVPYNEARYGSNTEALTDAEKYWPFVKDTGNAWYSAQKRMGKSDAQIKSYLRQFDRWDRYDHDGDGDFNEPDGYIDHFQAIHAGEGEEAGGGAQGADAIWSHRWYAYSDGIGSTGPTGNKLGGTQIGNTGVWIGDYTTEPENGGLGVFTHEFGHDLGLPDFYDTIPGGDNSTAFWTLMSSGSWLNRGGAAIGTVPGYMGPVEKLQLGWLDYRVVPYGVDADRILGPADKDGKGMPQAVIVTLPDKRLTIHYTDPYAGEQAWWGGSADDLNNTLTRDVDLRGASTAKMDAMLWADIEPDYDYLYTEVSTNGGSTWTSVGDPVSRDDKTWAPMSWNLNAYAGKQIKLRFRYTTDGGVHQGGPFLDNIRITKGSTVVLSDGAEDGDNGWAADGFTRATGTVSEMRKNYYFVENRVYSGYDNGLKVGPYNFGWASTRPDWVERFPFQNGMLVWYVDLRYEDNNTNPIINPETGQPYGHPGHGYALPVDLHPEAIANENGPLTNRRGAFDATFGLERTDRVVFHKDGLPIVMPSRPGVPVFDDSRPNRYYDAATNPGGSVIVAGSGTTIRVTSQDDRGWPMKIQIRFK